MVATNPTPSLAHQLDLECVAAARAHHAAEHALALLLAQVGAAELRELGYTSLVDYGLRRLQLSPRKTRALAHIGRSLGALPELGAAMADGQLPWTKARELLRVATPDNAAAWVALSQTVSSRELETHVGRAALGDPAPEVGAEVLEPAHTRMVLQGQTTSAQLLRDLVAKLRNDLGPEAAELSDLDLLGLHAQQVLHDWKHGEGDDPPSVERHTVVLYQCTDCRRTHGETCELDDATVAAAACHATVVDLHPGPDRGKQTRVVPARTARAVKHRDRRRCRVPGCRGRLWCDLHHIQPRGHGGSNAEDNLICLCSAHHLLLHDGRLAVERFGQDVEFRFANGGVVRTPLDPEAPAAGSWTWRPPRPGHRIGPDARGALGSSRSRPTPDSWSGL